MKSESLANELAKSRELPIQVLRFPYRGLTGSPVNLPDRHHLDTYLLFPKLGLPFAQSGLAH